MANMGPSRFLGLPITTKRGARNFLRLKSKRFILPTAVVHKGSPKGAILIATNLRTKRCIKVRALVRLSGQLGPRGMGNRLILMGILGQRSFRGHTNDVD